MGKPPLELPDKLSFRIGEVSRLLGVPAHVLRYWESEVRSLRPPKGESNQRRYRPRDVERLAELKRLLYEEGYTISGARKHLAARRGTHGDESEEATSGTAEDECERGLQSGDEARINDRASDEGGAAMAALEARCAELESALQRECDASRQLRQRVRDEVAAIRSLIDDSL